MEANLKAKELVEKFMPHAMVHWNEVNGWTEGEQKQNAVACALICIDEILDVLNKLLESGLHNDFGILDKRGYWQSVREAVNKL